ncbi:MAG TPA: hypothetical protein VFO98_09860 [Marmoricola sp.]|nr:hypothetical protein [Marmoricola sp.]
MTNVPEPGSTPARTGGIVWWWKLLDGSGAELSPSGGRQEFPTRSDAESWVGECWADLAEEGVASVVLFEGRREVYGPMSLAAE